MKKFKLLLIFIALITLFSCEKYNCIDCYEYVTQNKWTEEYINGTYKIIETGYDTISITKYSTICNTNDIDILIIHMYEEEYSKEKCDYYRIGDITYFTSTITKIKCNIDQ